MLTVIFSHRHILPTSMAPIKSRRPRKLPPAPRCFPTVSLHNNKIYSKEGVIVLYILCTNQGQCSMLMTVLKYVTAEKNEEFILNIPRSA
jgi:hypothetical protein